MTNKKPAFNPYLPSWEYVPDGEPHVYGDRVYVYGSHDRFGSYFYCLNDYICYSAPTDDLGNWRYEGVIYGRQDDPLNKNGDGCLFAPDVTRGPDGRYYLFYALSDRSVISVAVCDSPAGRYRFYGHVKYPDGSLLGTHEGDEFLFDPGVLTEGDKTYLYYGFGPFQAPERSGSMVCVLGPDMLTVINPPVLAVPNEHKAKGTSFEGHAFFEASSIRKVGDTYYFVYSSQHIVELCYATSKDPLCGFKYGGVLVTNNDIGITRHKKAERPTYYGGNNHGGMVELGGKWYIFYHRHTNGTNFCRQGCAEPLEIAEDGSIAQVEMTSCGLNGGPLPGKGYYSAHIACSLFCNDENPHTGLLGRNKLWMTADYPKITQENTDGEECEAFILNMEDGATAGYKFFDCKGVKKVSVWVRGIASGKMCIHTSIDGESVGEIPITGRNFWTEFSADVAIPDGVHELYFTYRGNERVHFKGFEIN